MLELTIIGNLGKDPETRYLPDGVMVCNFSVASTRKVNGETQTTWVEISAWRDLGERCHQFLKKGNKVFVRGFPEAHGFTRKDGTVDASLHMNAQVVEFLSSTKDGQKAADPRKDEEIPF